MALKPSFSGLVKMAGAGGFEPPNAGTKNRCLNHLATPQGKCPAAYAEALHAATHARGITSRALSGGPFSHRHTYFDPWVYPARRRRIDISRSIPHHGQNTSYNGIVGGIRCFRRGGGVKRFNERSRRWFPPAWDLRPGTLRGGAELCPRRIQKVTMSMRYQMGRPNHDT